MKLFAAISLLPIASASSAYWTSVLYFPVLQFPPLSFDHACLDANFPASVQIWTYIFRSCIFHFQVIFLFLYHFNTFILLNVLNLLLNLLSHVGQAALVRSGTENVKWLDHTPPVHHYCFIHNSLDSTAATQRSPHRLRAEPDDRDNNIVAG